MIRTTLSIAAFLGAAAILLGAFGSHSLKEKLDPDALQSFETGVRYMMYHVLALILINNTANLSVKSKRIISGFFIIGILCFSGSIFLLTLDIVPGSYIWFVTPLGGLFFAIGWLWAGSSFLKR